MQNPFEENTVPMRPTFLNILCILTFLWSAWKFYDAIPRVFNPEKVVATQEQANEMVMEMMSKYFSEKDLEKIEENQKETAKIFEVKTLVASGIAAILSSALLILGAIWMWGLRKKGFYVYIAGNAVGVLAPIILAGGMIGWTIGIAALVNAVIFTALYATNLKYLS